MPYGLKRGKGQTVTAASKTSNYEDRCNSSNTHSNWWTGLKESYFRDEINGIRLKNKKETKISETKSFFFEKIKKIDKHLARLTKKKRDKKSEMKEKLN